MTTARELMTDSPATVVVGAKVREAVDLLQSLDVRHLPVVKEDGTLIGMLSDRDLRSLSLPRFIGGEYAGEVRTALDASVTTLMNTDVVSVGEEADVAEIAELMIENRIGAVPVVDHDGALVGIVSYVDLLREMPSDRA